jgi:polar amino acid transport system substrate-binding protein
MQNWGLFFTFLFSFGVSWHTNAADQAHLKWAADITSGAPYAFVDPSNPKEIKGFEKDIMDAVARTMGRKLVIVQNEWESLVPGLNRGDYDVAAN